MEYFIVVFSLLLPFLNFLNNYLKNKKNESFLFLIVCCSIFQLFLGPLTMLGFKNYFVYSILTYILFSFGLISCILCLSYSFIKVFKNKTIFLELKSNFKKVFLNDFLSPWLCLIIISIFSLFFQSHFWDSAAYKTLSLNFREGFYNFGGLGNQENGYFLYQPSAGYYVSSVLSTENIGFMYNYVWIVFFYSFFVFFSWDFYKEFVFKKNEKKSLIGLIVIHISTIILVFLHHYVISGSNVVYAAVIFLLAMFYVKKQNFLHLYLSLLFVQFFTISGSLLSPPIVFALFFYLLFFKTYRDLLKFFLLFPSSLISSFSLFTKPSLAGGSLSTSLFLVYLVISFVLLLIFLLLPFLKNKVFFDKKIISKELNLNLKNNFLIFSFVFWFVAIIQIGIIFYISMFDKTYDSVPFIWCITSFVMSVIFYLIMLNSYFNKLNLSKVFWYQIIQYTISTFFLLFFFLLGNAYQIGILKVFKGIWNASSWRLLMTIPGVDFPYGIFMVYVVNFSYLFTKLSQDFVEKHLGKLKISAIFKSKNKLLVSSQILGLIGATSAVGIYGAITKNDSTLITSNVNYLYDFNKEQISFLTSFDKDLRNKTKDPKNNLILADTQVFEYIRYAYDFMGYNHNYWNYKEAQNKKDFTIYSNDELWNKYNAGWLQPLLEKTASLKVVILTKPNYFSSDETYSSYYDKFNSEIENNLNLKGFKTFDENTYFKIWYLSV